MYDCMLEIIIASNNIGKIKEVKEILKEYKITSLGELGIDIEVEEDGETFEQNAIKKAKEISKKLNGKMCIADDSGIEIEYLEGFPGVKTKRWYKGTEEERNQEILKKLEGVPKQKRKVTFIAAVSIAKGDNAICGIGTLEGYIATRPRGNNGFGFDEIFELENGKTLAELSAEEKNQISSRRKAIEICKQKLDKWK